MNKIKILPSQIANKIAAGEVVDRPAAVIKELVENSIDANADDITIVLEQAGKELIQVIDNGTGIDSDDLPLAFQRHATSKIETVNDLDKIITLGFRGEALPSIASVSRIEIKSRAKKTTTGTIMLLEEGKITNRKEGVLKQGTIISVKNLFYNTPARRNFLRADATEFNHINKTLKRFFLGNPEISFRVIHNEKEIYKLTSATIDERITQVLGENIYEGLVFVNEELNEDIRLEGYVCRPDKTRGNSENQFIFLNNRAIQNRNLNHAIFQGYGNLIERSQYPQFIMFLSILPQLVDINVHPTKMEVRFSNERAIYQLFLAAVRRAIQNKNMMPAFSLNSSDRARTEIDRQFKHGFFTSRKINKNANIVNRNDKQANQLTLSLTITKEDEAFDSELETSDASEVENIYQPSLWQVHRRYIISQIKSGLVIIDQHVAHERVLFEKFTSYLSEHKNIPSQKLLFPQTLQLALDDYLIFDEIKDWLAKISFSITELSGRTILIEGIPADVKVGYEGKILLEIIDYYRDNEGSKYSQHEKIAAAFACKNAIKSGDKLKYPEMSSLVNQLFATKEPYFCPHGRPIIVTIDLEEIDKKFKRS